jgi:hypothetical protein
LDFLIHFSKVVDVALLSRLNAIPCFIAVTHILILTLCPNTTPYFFSQNCSHICLVSILSYSEGPRLKFQPSGPKSHLIIFVGFSDSPTNITVQ